MAAAGTSRDDPLGDRTRAVAPERLPDVHAERAFARKLAPGIENSLVGFSCSKVVEVLFVCYANGGA